MFTWLFLFLLSSMYVIVMISAVATFIMTNHATFPSKGAIKEADDALAADDKKREEEREKKKQKK